MRTVFKNEQCVVHLGQTNGGQFEVLLEVHQQHFQLRGFELEDAFAQLIPSLFQVQVIQDLIYCFKYGMIESFYSQLPSDGRG